MMKSSFSKATCLQPATLLSERLLHWHFHVTFTEFFRIAVLDNKCEELLLNPYQTKEV